MLLMSLIQQLERCLTHFKLNKQHVCICKISTVFLKKYVQETGDNLILEMNKTKMCLTCHMTSVRGDKRNERIWSWTRC